MPLTEKQYDKVSLQSTRVSSRESGSEAHSGRHNENGHVCMFSAIYWWKGMKTTYGKGRHTPKREAWTAANGASIYTFSSTRDVVTIEVNASYHILSDTNGVLTVAICVNGEIGVIVAGKTETMLIKLKNIFKER